MEYTQTDRQVVLTPHLLTLHQEGDVRKLAPIEHLVEVSCESRQAVHVGAVVAIEQRAAEQQRLDLETMREAKEIRGVLIFNKLERVGVPKNNMTVMLARDQIANRSTLRTSSTGKR